MLKEKADISHVAGIIVVKGVPLAQADTEPDGSRSG
jgi:hypothetical protein